MKRYLTQDWDVIRATLKHVDSRVVYVMLLDVLLFAASMGLIWFFGMANPVLLQQQIASGEADVFAILVRGIGLLATVILAASAVQVAVWRVIRQKSLSKDIPDYVFGSFAGFMWVFLLLLLVNLLPGSPFEWGSTWDRFSIVVPLLRQFILIFFPIYYLSILFSDYERTKKIFRPLLTFFRVGILGAWRYPLFFAVSIFLFTAIIFISILASGISPEISFGVTFVCLLVFAAWLRFSINERLIQIGR